MVASLRPDHARLQSPQSRAEAFSVRTKRPVENFVYFNGRFLVDTLCRWLGTPVSSCLITD